MGVGETDCRGQGQELGDQGGGNCTGPTGDDGGFRTRRGWAGVPQSWERVTLASGSTSLSLSFPLYKKDPESGPFYYQGEGPRGVRRVEPRPARRKRRRVSAMVTLTLAPSVPQANLGLSRVLQQTGEASPPSLLQPKC